MFPSRVHPHLLWALGLLTLDLALIIPIVALMITTTRL